MERKHQRNAAEFFDGTNVARVQKKCGLAPTPFFPIAGIEVWRDADDRFHQLADRIRSMGWRIVRVSDPQEADGLIALQVIGSNDVGTVKASGPNALCGLFVPARKHIGESSDNAAADGKCRFQRKI